MQTWLRAIVCRTENVIKKFIQRRYCTMRPKWNKEELWTGRNKTRAKDNFETGIKSNKSDEE